MNSAKTSIMEHLKLITDDVKDEAEVSIDVAGGKCVSGFSGFDLGFF